MTLEQFQNLKIGDIVVTKVISSKQNRVNPVTNIDRGNLKLHIGRSGKWRSYSQFEVLTAEYVVKWIKRRIDSKSSPHVTIEVKSDTEVTFKFHKKVHNVMTTHIYFPKITSLHKNRFKKLKISTKYVIIRLMHICSR